MPALRHLEQRAATGLLYVVAVGGQSENIQRRVALPGNHDAQMISGKALDGCAPLASFVA